MMTRLPLPPSWPPVMKTVYKPWLDQGDADNVFFGSVSLQDKDSFYPASGNAVVSLMLVMVLVAVFGGNGVVVVVVVVVVAVAVVFRCCCFLFFLMFCLGVGDVVLRLLLLRDENKN